MYRFKWNILILFVVLLLEAQAFAFPPMLSSGSGGVTQDDPLIIALDPDADGDPSDCTAIVAKENVVTAGSLVNSVVLLEDLGDDAKRLVTTQATTGASDVVEITGYFNDYNRYLVVVASDTDNQALTIYDTDNTPANGTELVIQNGGANTLTMSTVSGQQELAPAYVVIEQGESITLVYHTDRWYELCRSVANVSFSSLDMGGASAFEIPNSDDPDIDTAGEISWDTDGWLRAYDGAAQVAIGRKIEAIHVTVITPQDLADAERDAFMIWTNESGMSFIVTGWKGWAGTDDTTLAIEEADADGTSNVATVDAVELATGAGPFTGGDTTITAATIEDGHVLRLDFDDTDDPTYVKMTIYGYYLADVN